MRAALITAAFVLGLIFIALVISLLTGCAWDSVHNRDGTRKHWWQDDKDANVTPVEMPMPKG